MQLKITKKYNIGIKPKKRRFAIKIKNGKRFCFSYGTVRAFIP